MPVVYRCRVCGQILYVFARVGQDSYGVPTPGELIYMYAGVCPRCGSPLRRPRPDDIVVKPNGPQELLAVLEEAKRSMRISFRSLERYLAELRRLGRSAGTMLRVEPRAPSNLEQNETAYSSL